MRLARIAAGYALAVAMTALAVAFRLALDPLFGPVGLPFITFFPAVMTAAWFGGLGPGLAATLLSALSADFWFMEPRFAFWVTTAADAAGTAVFAGIARS